LHAGEKREIIFAYGNRNIQATHKTTFEITREAHLSKRGTCIIATAADKALADLSSGFKEKLQSRNARIDILVEAGGISERVSASGSPDLILTHPTDMVVRKSSYVCKRTLAIQADKAAYEFSRELVEKLKNPKQEVKITLTVKA